MDFVKVEGLGNDFIVMEGGTPPSRGEVVAWCERHHGIGADGVLLVDPLGDNRVEMRYWNADGGEAEMCGNGLRCIARLAVERGWVDGRDVTIETAAGPRPATVLDDGNVRALVGHPVRGRLAELSVAGVTVHPVRIGNPHAVHFVSDVATAPVADLGPRISRDPMFPGGSNVEFVLVEQPDRLVMRVWERGVGETAASGTGAAASAFAAREFRGAADVVDVQLPGGELRIELVDGEAWMTGPARIVFRGELPDV